MEGRSAPGASRWLGASAYASVPVFRCGVPALHGEDVGTDPGFEVYPMYPGLSGAGVEVFDHWDLQQQVRCLFWGVRKTLTVMVQGRH